MKILLYSWGANNDPALKANLIKYGFDVNVNNCICNNYLTDMNFSFNLLKDIHEKHAEAVISFNYFPIISMICDTAGIDYYSIVYDCPHYTLFSNAVKLPCNHIYVFDKVLVEKLSLRGISTVHYMWLPVDEMLFGANAYTDKKFLSDVSFVGSLYDDKYLYFDSIFDENGKALKYVKKKCFDYENVIDVKTDKENMEYLAAEKYMQDNGLMLGNDYFAISEDVIVPAVYDRKITNIERTVLAEKLSNNAAIDFKLYTNASSTDDYGGNYGTVDYQNEMPKVFYNSKINLNSSLRSIQSGIPLRALDIMICGGFLLSNYQSELSELFKEDEEITLYRSLEECLDKINFYLKNDDVRRKIATNGKEAVQKKCTYEAAFRTMGLLK